MKQILVLCCLIGTLSFFLVNAEDDNEQLFDLTDLRNLELETDFDETDLQRKRESGYAYRRPGRFMGNGRQRFRVNLSGPNGRQSPRQQQQVNRPFNKYGLPKNQHAQAPRPNQQMSHRQKFRFPNQPANSGHGLMNQDIPSPIRDTEFVTPSPIASQNNEPFALNSANYLPPQNQDLPEYSLVGTFSQTQATNEQQNQNIPLNIKSQNLIQAPPPQQISDATLFLTQNAEAIQQLYGAVAPNQDFEPIGEKFQDHNNQVQNPNLQFENIISTTQSSNSNTNSQSTTFPSYASGTLSPEAFHRLQSQEKDRLIAQLQQVLAAQQQNQGQSDAETSTETDLGRYAQNHDNYVREQELLAAIGDQFPSFDKTTKFQELIQQNSGGSLGTGNIGFNQDYIQGTNVQSTGYHYDAVTPTQPSSNPQPSPSSPDLHPPEAPKGNGHPQIGLNIPTQHNHPSTVGTTGTGFPSFGGFVPSFSPGTNFAPNVNGPTLTVSSQPTDTPTHFGLPIPTNPTNNPTGGFLPTLPSSGSTPTEQPNSNIHPISLPTQPGNSIFSSFNPFVSPFRPLGSPLQPVSPSAHPAPIPAQPVSPLGHPVSTPAHTPSNPQHPVSIYPVAAPIYPASTPVQPVSTPVYPLSTPVHSVPASIRPVSIPIRPVSFPVRPVSIPVHSVTTPVHPIASPVHPVTTPVQSVIPVQPISTPTHSVPTSVHPIVQPAHIPAAVPVHPTYGVQPANYPLAYKPTKAVYPLYYYQNVAYPLAKPTVPAQPWSYAPSYGQAKPSQIWK